jgi:dGTPase
MRLDSRRTRAYTDDKAFPEHRTPYWRDRDSVLYSNFFRRLAGVTQVVHVAEGHIFHNRLVHSLKVAQIGRSLVDVLTKRANATDEGIINAVGGVDSDVVETACLAHDLGHPPFGHIAEEELNKWADKTAEAELKDSTDKGGGFEGNPQSFRIVTRLAITDRTHRGLNLTSASLNAILKYPWARGKKGEGKKYKKWGYYEGDKSSFDLARERDNPSYRRSAEAEIMDYADDVTYSIHDVEDFYRAGIVPLDRLLTGGPELTKFIDRMRAQEMPEAVIEAAKGIFQEVRKNVPPDLLVPFQASTAQYKGLRLFETYLIKRFLTLEESERHKLRFEPEGTSAFLYKDERLENEVEALKLLMRFYVYEAPALVSQQHGQREVIRKLCEVFWIAANDPKKGGLFPPPFGEYLREANDCSEPQRTAEKIRLVTDVVASMTEQQVMAYHARLTGISPGSLADRLFGA